MTDDRAKIVTFVDIFINNKKEGTVLNQLHMEHIMYLQTSNGKKKLSYFDNPAGLVVKYILKERFKYEQNCEKLNIKKTL